MRSVTRAQGTGVHMKRRYFGTDGIRGQSNVFPMTPDLAMRVGIAAGTIFRRGNHRHRVGRLRTAAGSGQPFPRYCAATVARGCEENTSGVGSPARTRRWATRMARTRRASTLACRLVLSAPRSTSLVLAYHVYGTASAMMLLVLRLLRVA